MMATPPDAESLESRINKATNPLNKDTDWGSIHAFCDQLNGDLEGPQLATRLLAHKIQSPQEWESMQALLVLERCMKACGKRFHSEVGKFRFLNELIKVVSPKYLGSRSPEPVKQKVLELIYSWTLGLPDEAKILDAYQMLKKQGIVKQDPELPPDKMLNPPPPRPKNAIFEDEEKSKMLSRLLTSTHPDDLKAANKLIKEMVLEDQRQAEKVSKRVSTIEEVKESVGLLSQLLQEYHPAAPSTPGNAELLQDLYQRCEKMRPTLFRLASDTEDNDEALAEILQANDSLTQVINQYKLQVRGEEVNGNTSSPTSILLVAGGSTALLDLSGLDTSPQSPPSFPDLLDDELMSLGNSTHTSNAPSHPEDSTAWDSFQSSDSIEADIPAAPSLLSPDPPSHTHLPPSGPAPAGSSSAPSTSALDELDLLGKTLLQQSLPPDSLHVKWSHVVHSQCNGQRSSGEVTLHVSGLSLCSRDRQQVKPTLRDLQSKSGSSVTPSPIPAFCAEQPGPLLSAQASLGPALLDSPPAPEVTLKNVFVPLESIRPSSLLPVTVFDGHSLRVLFHFARDPPAERPDVLVVILSMLSSAPLPVTHISLEVTTPKCMAVKLQPPSGTDLPAFNPLLPPAAVTQVLLLANPDKEKASLQYTLSFTLGGQRHAERGTVDQFPPADTWGAL
uniref:ADP-ribosylation factor-binding protein GGA1 n=1 Tax=Gadus morhua TaxID=8049 RepID=A0A8C5ANA3_GADMO